MWVNWMLLIYWEYGVIESNGKLFYRVNRDVLSHSILRVDEQVFVSICGCCITLVA